MSIGLPEEAAETFGRAELLCRTDAERLRSLRGRIRALDAVGRWEGFDGLIQNARSLASSLDPGYDPHDELELTETELLFPESSRGYQLIHFELGASPHDPGFARCPMARQSPGDHFQLAAALRRALAAHFAHDTTRATRARRTVVSRFDERVSLPQHLALANEAAARLP